MLVHSPWPWRSPSGWRVVGGALDYASLRLVTLRSPFTQNLVRLRNMSHPPSHLLWRNRQQIARIVLAPSLLRFSCPGRAWVRGVKPPPNRTCRPGSVAADLQACQRFIPADQEVRRHGLQNAPRITPVADRQRPGPRPPPGRPSAGFLDPACRGDTGPGPAAGFPPPAPRAVGPGR